MISPSLLMSLRLLILFGQGHHNGLSYPQNGITTKLVTFGAIKTLGCFHQSHIALIDQVSKRQTMTPKLLYHFHDKVTIPLQQLGQSLAIAPLNLM
jgi:hypothetical protein